MSLKAFHAWWQRRRIDPDAALLEALHSERQFRAILDVERMRVERGGGRFALVVARFDDSPDRDFLLFAQYLRGRVRATDHAGLMGDRRIGVILWSTDAAGARQFIESIAVKGQDWTQPNYEAYVYPGADGGGDDLGDGPDEWAEERLQHDVCEILQTLHADDENDDENADVEEAGERSEGQDKTKALNYAGGDDSLPTPNSHEFSTTRGQQHVATLARQSATTETQLVAESPAPADVINTSSCASVAPFLVQPMERLFVQPLPCWKRFIDLVGAVGGLIVLAPLLAMTALAVRWTSSGPSLFAQLRSGLGGRTFTLYKFRTMCVDAESHKAGLRQFSEQDGPAFKMSNDPRLTRLGKFLRKSCLDELPQLWNIVKGDMTLVGPRPLPCDEQAGCQGWQQRRLDVTPGLTCIWQVRGKSKVSFTEWMRMDIRYIKARTLLQDVKLVVETIWAVVLRRASC